MNLIEQLKEDVRFEESLKACMNCGMCTAVCPAAEFYDYDPRRICDLVQRGDDEELEQLMRSDTIWYCGQCMSCKTRCPRGNVPGELIQKNILEIGYCVYPDRVDPDYHPEQGPVWEWYHEHIADVAPKLGANYHGKGPGALRDIPQEDLDEVRRIFEVTGGMELRDNVIND